MIQRIQSLYWTLALILEVMFLFSDYAMFLDSDGFYNLGPACLYESSSGSLLFSTLPSLILTLLVMVLLILAILLYKRRPLQIRLSLWSIILQLGQMVLMTYYYYVVSGRVEGCSTFNWPFILPLFAAVFTFLAMRGVRKDHNFLRSIDRLR